MELRRFQSHHLNVVEKLYLESRLATFTWLDTVEFDLSDFDRDTEGESIWVAIESNKVVGFVSIWAPECFIHHLFVSPRKLRGGVGLKLLDLAKQQYPSLSLKCLSQNINATEFYLSQGFTITETVGNGAESYHLMQWKSQTIQTI
ncbi:GNAT family N-acetyltransferase [Vibrio sp. 10N.247.310.17]|uniref:GNAT family N-acetyltransferase n=1 Tax=Vibrio sp. 10N.247.310.17 TaxID=3229979 RepID=UPI003551F6B6